MLYRCHKRWLKYVSGYYFVFLRMDLHKYIAVSPNVQFGKPVFKGTRVPVQTLFFHLKQGVSFNEFLEDFPGVSEEQAEAVLAYAALVFQSENWEKIDEIIA